MSELLDSLIAETKKHMINGENLELLPGVSVFTSQNVTCPVSVLYEPMLCFVLQGTKEVTVGSHVLQYSALSYLVNSVELPVSNRVINATAERPYIALSMILDTEKLLDVISDFPKCSAKNSSGYAVSQATDNFVDPWYRLLKLLTTPEDISFMRPLIEREILYRVLQGDQQCILRQIAGADIRVTRVQKIIQLIRKNYKEQLHISILAEDAGMSQASLHRHFRAVTGMTPIQYQKILRLQNARQLLAAGCDVGDTAWQIGYESPSQFSREYQRMFGLSPSRDAKRLRLLRK